MADVTVPPARAAGADPDSVSVELSSRRTGMSFQRTRMSADRTLMSVIRTSLSLISFGFTIYQFFHHLESQKVVAESRAPRNFGLALLLLGIAMIIAGIVFQLQFMRGLRAERAAMAKEGLIHAESHFPASFTLVVAVLLLLVGLAAILSIAFRSGPFA